MSEPNKLATNIGLSLVSILVIFVLLEIIANVFLVSFATDRIFRRYASFHQLTERYKGLPYTRHRYLGYYPTPGFQRGGNKQNSLGYRGEEVTVPKPEGEFRIACLGGSTTYTTAVKDYRLSYPALLEKELHDSGYRVSVVNAGAGNWSTWETLINFELRVLDLEPDMFIVYHGVNDVKPRLVWPPEAYTGDNGGRRSRSTQSVFMPGIFEHSTVIRGIMIRLGLAQSHASLERALDVAPPEYYGDDFLKQFQARTYPDEIFKEISAMQMLETNKPVFFQRNIESLIAVAKHNGVVPVLATFAYSPLFEDEPTAVSDEFKYAYEEQNLLLKEIGAKTGSAVFDFSASFPKDVKYFSDGNHVTEEGSALKAKKFAEFIIAQGLIPDTFRVKPETEQN